MLDCKTVDAPNVKFVPTQGSFYKIREDIYDLLVN